MPRINYSEMPYNKENTGENVPQNAFYNPNPENKESPEIYRGYWEYDYPKTQKKEDTLDCDGKCGICPITHNPFCEREKDKIWRNQ